MRRIREKWNSSRGASILLALLFLLVCMLVAASVLMAAVSNAGKLRSNREEQRKYLTLSSALRLVCGELTESRYQGKYTYTVTPVYDDSETADPADPDHYRHTYTQGTGAYTCELNSTVEVLPLRNSLDYLFGQKLAAGAGVTRNPDDEYTFERLPAAMNFPVRYTLTVAADGFETVTISFQLRADGLIGLTAALPADANGHSYAMEAELLPETPLDKTFVLKNLGGENSTEEVRWKLNWIAKKET